MSTINDRLFEIAAVLYDGNISNLGKAIGMERNSIANYVSKSDESKINKRLSKPGFDMLEKIVNTLNINPEWLITGQGKMLRAKSPENAGIINEELLQLCKNLVANYQQRDQVVQQLITLLHKLE